MRQFVAASLCSTGKLFFSNSPCLKSSLLNHSISSKTVASMKKNPLEFPYRMIDSLQELKAAAASLAKANCVALDVEALCTKDQRKKLGDISLVQACGDSENVVYLFDALTLPQEELTSYMGEVFTNTNICKMFFDCRRDVEALHSQLGLIPTSVLDLQLYFTAWQWKLRSVRRRSSMGYVLNSVAGIARQEGDSAVQTAMSLGNRPVWDVRPLPEHFLEYAAGDVRHIMLMTPYIIEKVSKVVPVDRVERITAKYVEHYSQSAEVEHELDPSPAEVHLELLERFIGPGGVCQFCGAPGHTETECFKKQSNTMRCTFCGSVGHSARNCYKQHPHLLKCEACGQVGHSASHCFKKNPCKHCGGSHQSNSCHKRLERTKYFDFSAKSS